MHDATEKMYDVFISHSHRDRERAHALFGQLAAWGISAYVDIEDMPLSALPDPDLAESLVEKLRKCRLLVFAFSEEAADSRWMPWELGLAHGVIGRAVLWPFTTGALQAKATQEYLHLYEALSPDTAEKRLKALVDDARWQPVRPADLRAMRDLANVTNAKLPEFNKPEVSAEFTVKGPMQLYFAWLDELNRAWRQG